MEGHEYLKEIPLKIVTVLMCKTLIQSQVWFRIKSSLGSVHPDCYTLSVEGSNSLREK